MRLRQVHFFATLQFRTIVDLIGVDRMVNNALTSLDTTQATTNLNFIRRVYPAVPGTVPLPAALPRATYTDDTTQSVDDRCAAVFDFAEGLQSGSWPIIAMVSGMPCRGAASLGGHHGYAVISDEEDTAHELGHALAIKHPGGFGPPSTEDPAVVAGHGDECASSCDDDWPWTHGLIGAYGFNTATMTPVVPGTAETDPHDFMSYGGGMMWISPRNWGRLFNYFGVFEHYFGRFESDTAVSGAADAVPGPAIALGLQDRVTARPSGQESGGRYLWVRGVFEERGGVTLKPFYELELTAAPRVRNGPYLIEALDSAGRVVATRSFEAERVHIDLAGGGARDLPPRFSEYLPLPEGARVASVVVRDERDVLATRARSAAAPEVTILSPTAAGFAGGRIAPAVQWTGADRDGDPLFYRVEYSPRPEPSVRGGRVWLPLATDLTGGDLAVALDGLPGGPDARVRVIATDGFNTTGEVSPDFFVADKPPAVEILAPEPGPLAVQIQAGERLMLRGVGSDLEDGDLSGAALTWRSNRDGQLGSGNVVEVSTLSLGIHTITLTGTDSRGEQASASVTVAVLPRLNTQPVAVAGPDQRVSMGATVRLDGSGSFDEDGDPLGYHWAIVGRPPQSDTPLRDPESARPSFTPDRPGVYTLELRVHDGALISLPDRVLVAVDAPLPALASPFPTPVATLVPVTPPPGMTITFPTPTATFAPVTRTPTAVVTPTVTATSAPVTRTPTPTVTPTPVCPPLGTPTLQAVPVGGNQVRVTWNVEGGCGRISGTITAQYTDQRAAFATHDVTATSGAVIDAPPTRCEGTFTVRYTLELRDAGGQRATATTVQSLLWLC
ncbi:MAG: PKD domain-containing protein [Dehalococcoidia bacterium]